MRRYVNRLWIWWHHNALPRKHHEYLTLNYARWSCSCGSERTP